VGHWLYHWLYQDFWAPLWPNLAASLVVYAFVAAKLRAIRRLHEETRAMHARHHAEHMDALDPDTGGGMGDVLAEVRKGREDFQQVLATLTALYRPGEPGSDDEKAGGM
jgi:hypothetical protein